MLQRWLTRSARWIWGIVAIAMLGFLSACGGSDPPGIPASLTATGGDAQVTLTWSAVDGADSYNLYWSTTAAVTKETGTKITGVTSPYAHTGLANGSTYYYVVTAVGGGGEGKASNVATVTLAPAAPAAPTVAAGLGETTVTWATTAGATSYNLYWSTSAGVTPATGTKIEAAVSPYVHTGLTPGLAYYYVVTGVNAGGEGAASAEGTVTLAPASPAIVSAVSGDHQVTVDFLNVVGATSYNLYWSNTAGVTKATGTKIENVTAPYAHTGLTNGTTYYYVATAVGAGGESPDSEQVSAVPQVPLPTAPQNVSATLTPETTKSVTIQWSPPTTPVDPADILQYNLYRSTAADLSAAVKTEKVTSPWIDLVPAGQVTYYYAVKAQTASGEGPASAIVSATPRGSPGTGSGGGEPTGTYGNNLSVPMVFADGVGILGGEITGTDYTDLATGLRPTATDITDPFPYFDPATIYLLNNVSYYKQKTASTWQATWLNGKASLQTVELDWGDNLSSAALSATQTIRVETVLRQYKGTEAWAADVAMSAYPMALLYGSGITEMQGTTGIAGDATERRVFAATARLKIQKLVDGLPVDHACGFNGSIADGFAVADGKATARYSAEINVGGSQTYGFNWRLNQCSATDKAGTWRITFSFDDQVSIGGKTYNNNTAIGSLHSSETGAVLFDSKTAFIDVVVN